MKQGGQMSRLFEIKVLEPETGRGSKNYALDGMNAHPRRYRYINCWYSSGNRFTPVGAQHSFIFEDGYCPQFMDNEAWVVGEIDSSRISEPDRFELADG
jgi:hypothetical protein